MLDWVRRHLASQAPEIRCKAVDVLAALAAQDAGMLPVMVSPF